MFNEGMEWEEERTWIPVERNLEMQEKKKRENICVNIISSFKSEQANVLHWDYECGIDLLILLTAKWGLGAYIPEGKLTSCI